MPALRNTQRAAHLWLLWSNASTGSDLLHQVRRPGALTDLELRLSLSQISRFTHAQPEQEQSGQRKNQRDDE